ncbi:hypothetical protein ESP57_05465 [Agromyces fucosus]|uniref:Uncharacterized protein n=1 Tax=Agromyces fucosus TaxID=41985 RepID=A0A4Q2JY86_9MICO|nr:hypothetical protein [Agromyces fucosus]RXZ51218.1 hypothetical protein ESP57_05465 [Agromyces fucosus]
MTTGPKAIIIGAGALAVLGLVLVLLPGPTATFGWFAYQPVGDFGFVGGAPFVPASKLWGMGILAIAAVLAAFVVGWVLGKRRGLQEPGTGSIDRAPDVLA